MEYAVGFIFAVVFLFILCSPSKVSTRSANIVSVSNMGEVYGTRRSFTHVASSYNGKSVRNYYAVTAKPVKTNAFLVRYKDGRTEYKEVATTSPLYDSYIKKMTDQFAHILKLVKREVCFNGLKSKK